MYSFGKVPTTTANAATEQRLLETALRPVGKAADTLRPVPAAGIRYAMRGTASNPVATLSGAGLTPDLTDRLIAWRETQG